MAAKRPDQREVRLLISKKLHSLLKKLAGVQEKSLNRVMNEALERFVEDADIREIIDRHQLEFREGEE